MFCPTNNVFVNQDMVYPSTILKKKITWQIILGAFLNAENHAVVLFYDIGHISILEMKFQKSATLLLQLCFMCLFFVSTILKCYNYNSLPSSNRSIICFALFCFVFTPLINTILFPEMNRIVFSSFLLIMAKKTYQEFLPGSRQSFKNKTKQNRCTGVEVNLPFIKTLGFFSGTNLFYVLTTHFMEILPQIH